MDQLVFEELVHERFPRLGLYIIIIQLHFFLFDIFVEQSLNATFNHVAVNHLDYLGVQVAWVSGPWFLTIFMNMLPWESGQVLYVSLDNKLTVLL